MPGHDAGEEALSTRRTTIDRVAATGSTNDDLLARIRAAAAAGETTFAPCLLVADRQSAGRGRHGRTWHAEAGRSLTFSLAWQSARADLAGLSLAVGVVLADALEPARETTRIGLKWPNDLWLVDADADQPLRGGRKLAGILVETAPLGAQRVAVIGVGINVHAQTVTGAASGIGSLDEIEPGATPSSTLALVGPALVAALERFDALGFAAFAERFAARDVLRGRAVAGAPGDVAGVAAGVGSDGALLVDTGTRVVAVTSGDWRLRLGERAEQSC
ncbi:MAG TPA: biotin--[acetyl-CoA-carboxylase] ligase [Caldimonas sp.]|jgi:BirA family biotin operon repressor/biotin-[acetyl-CoA-carboxylase] ligase|nr:biotin--[acetyl-CoA-carboxylase] ligase [Caldimonas sp.]HEX4234655.1 biotin--[acetyl-CoA-carboxylase] ligase [Caldimonas sp.]